MTELNGHKTSLMILLYYTVYLLQVEIKFKLITISTKVDFFSLGQVFFNLGYYELSKKGFPFFGECNKNNGAWIFRKDKKTPSSSFPLPSVLPLTISLFPSPLPYYQQTVPLTLNFHNIPCHSKYSNPCTNQWTSEISSPLY